MEDIADSDDLLDLPVWDMPHVECLTDLTHHNKEDTLPHFYTLEFHEIADGYPNHRAIIAIFGTLSWTSLFSSFGINLSLVSTIKLMISTLKLLVFHFLRVTYILL